MIQEFEIDGNTFKGYLALPPSGSGPGVLLLHAWWGLNDFIVTTCQRLAQAGFVTLALDYYRGEVASTIEQAQALKQKLDRKAVNQQVARAVDHLCGNIDLSSAGIGVIGYSLGASYALEVARNRNQQVKAVVLYYGTGGGKFDKTQAEFLGHFAEHDRWGAHPKKVIALAERIRSTGQPATIYTYPESEHWFAESDRPEYNQVAAELAWERTLSFLRRTLG